MSQSGCEEFLWWFCERQARDPEFRARLAEAMRSPLDPMRAAVRVIEEADPVYGPTALKEIDELPELALSTMLQAWLDAATRGLDFRANSLRPDRPLEFARARRVRVSVDEDETSISVNLSHIPNRHPSRG